MPQIKVEIKNIAEIRAAFSKAPVKMTKELNRAVQSSIFYIERASKLRTPVDTGRLRSSHKRMFTQLKGEIGTHTDYDSYVHWGTKFILGRPYLFEAVMDGEIDINKFFTDAVQKVLDDIAREV